MNGKERTDWRVRATIDQEAVRREIETLLDVYGRTRGSYCIVSAGDEEEAAGEALDHFEGMLKIPRRFISKLRSRRLPT